MELCSVHIAQMARYSETRLLSMACQRSKLRGASSTPLLMHFDAWRRLNKHGTVIEGSREQHCSSFYVLQLGSQPCTFLEQQNLISLLIPPTATHFSPDDLSLHVIASNLYVFPPGDGRPYGIPMKVEKHRYLNDFMKISALHILLLVPVIFVQ